MELFLFIIGFFVVKWLWGVVTGGDEATSSQSGRGSSSSIQRSMGEFEVKAEIERVDNNDGESFEVLKVLGRGLIPNNMRMDLTASLSLFSKDKDGNWEPILSALDEFQEDSTTVYQSTKEHENVDYNVGYLEWSPLGVYAFVPTLIPAYSGKQVVKCVFAWLDPDVSTEVYAGRPQDRESIVGIYSHSIMVSLKDTVGYIERAESRDKIKPLAVKLAVATALSDGHLDTNEGEVIKSWIIKQVEILSGDHASKLKQLCNDAMKSSFKQASNGTLTISDIVSEINEHADHSEKYEVIELCFDVMAADGDAHSDEIDLINKIALSLKLDPDELAKMKDQKILGLNVSGHTEHASTEAILGIDPGWDLSRKKSYLREQFAKWNSRIHSIDDQKEKENAQHMLDLIAEARNSL